MVKKMVGLNSGLELGSTDPAMILLMGVTGSGKSYFINRLVEGAVKEGHGIDSETKECRLVTAHISDEESIAIIDTPGFDDSKRPDGEVFEEIAEFLAIQYKLGIKLKGIIYFHRITDPKMPGSAIKYFQMFQKLVGSQAMPNVVLATTMWGKMSKESEGLAREQELRDKYWSVMEAKGSHIEIYDGSSDMAEAMVMELSSKDDIVLELQREICEEGKRLDETAIGGMILPEIERNLRDQDKGLRSLEERIAEATQRGNEKAQKALEMQRLELKAERQREERRRSGLKRKVSDSADEKIQKKKRQFKLRDGLSLLAAVIGVTVNIVIHFLPIG